jgi:hypothetical protein
MKRLIIGAAVAGGATFAFRLLARKARKVHDQCRDMIATCEQSKPTVSAGCGS